MHLYKFYPSIIIKDKRYEILKINMKFELSPQVSELDEQFTNYCSMFWDCLNEAYNKAGYRKVLERNEKLQKKIASTSAERKDDELYLENTQTNLEAHQKYLSHLYWLEPSIEEVVESAYGPKALSSIRRAIKNYDHGKAWEGKRKFEEAKYHLEHQLTEEAKTAIDKKCEEIEKNLKDYSQEKGLLPFNFSVRRIEDPERIERSSWKMENNTLWLHPSQFAIYREPGEVGVRVDPMDAYVTAFHELFGHGVHSYFSEDLPRGLSFLPPYRPVTIPGNLHIEGLAQYRKEEAYDFVAENAEDLGIEKEDAQNLRLFHEVDRNLLGYYAPIMLEKQLEEPDFDLEAHLENLTGIPRLAKEWADADRENLWQSVKNLSYFLGPRHVKKVIKSFEQEDNQKLQRAISTGVWSWKTHRKAVEFLVDQL